MLRSGKTATGNSGHEHPVQRKKAFRPYPVILSYWEKNEICRFLYNSGIGGFNKNPELAIGKMYLRDFLGQESYEASKQYISAALSGTPNVIEHLLKIEGKKDIQVVMTFIPDTQGGKTRGFYFHMADVGPLRKRSEEKLADEKELLKAIIDIQEKERSSISDILRNNINQLLVFVNLMLQGINRESDPAPFSDDMIKAIHQAIQELNKLSNQLYPSGLSMLGLLPSIENLFSNFRQPGAPDISFYCNDSQVEELSHHDKLSVYRIVQDFVGLILNRRTSSYIRTELTYRDYCLIIRIVYNGIGPKIDHSSDEFRDIRSRIDYYSGKIREFHRDNEEVFMAYLAFNRIS